MHGAIIITIINLCFEFIIQTHHVKYVVTTASVHSIKQDVNLLMHYQGCRVLLVHIIKL